jgi:lipoyl(octanoyl) transferase
MHTQVFKDTSCWKEPLNPQNALAWDASTQLAFLKHTLQKAKEGCLEALNSEEPMALLSHRSLCQTMLTLFDWWLTSPHVTWQARGKAQPIEQMIAQKEAYYQTMGSHHPSETHIPQGALWILEHTPVLTVGKTAQKEPLWQTLSTLSSEARQRHTQGIPSIAVTRAGGWTWHGEGQWVIYPLLNARLFGLRPLQYGLLYWMQATVQALGIEDTLVKTTPEHLGVWARATSKTPYYKVASCGLHIKAHAQGWHTYHGVALNVGCSLEGFHACQPCGLPSEMMGRLIDLYPLL